jgi:hypothetical protein
MMDTFYQSHISNTRISRKNLRVVHRKICIFLSILRTVYRYPRHIIDSSSEIITFSFNGGYFRLS